MLGLIAVGATSLFETIALFAGPHWSLYEDETVALASAIDSALDTLPGEYYAVIRKIIENYFPWLTLSIITSKIVIPRIAQSQENQANPTRPVNPSQTDRSETSEPIRGEPTTYTGAVNGTIYRTQSSFR